MRQGSKSSAGSAKKTKSLPQRAPQVTLVGPTHHHRHSKSGRQKLAGLEASVRKSWSEIEQSRRMSTSSIEISKRKQLADTETSKSTGRSDYRQGLYTLWHRTKLQTSLIEDRQHATGVKIQCRIGQENEVLATACTSSHLGGESVAPDLYFCTQGAAGSFSQQRVRGV
ncbi:hypothetical protein HPB51_010253 [Rhipicephalus microplus]|uniref:Uncharacterized protein n=1 Tax=Rhipicephalus microplus TaxID=6941 RepID=A0A9J6D5F4_RHIMP|nr:hypothetical protein HPB51_010253 [Rhipicephalus microplus]